MDTNSWKKIIDGLDDDIVDSAAERFSSEHSGSAGDFPDGGNPVEYKYPAKKKHWGLYIGGSAAVAAVVAGVILLNNYGLTLSSHPMVAADSYAEESSTPAVTSSAALTTPFAAYMQKSEPYIQCWLSSIETDGIDFVLFEEYFYGVWESTPEDTVDSDGEPEQIELSYGDCDLFGPQYDYTCLGTILTEDGCYMVAAGGGQYDLWYVPENDRSSLFIDRDVWIKDGQVVYVDSVIQCASTELYSGYGTGKPQEDGSLGYFGQEKLAQKMGLTTEYLFEGPVMSESTSVYPDDGSTARNWARTYGMRGTDIWLVSRSNSKVVVTELFEDENSGVRALFDITWTNSGGEWLTTGFAVSDTMQFSNMYESMDKNEFQTFEDMFAGTWTDKSTGEELQMDYSADPFRPGDHVYLSRIYDGVVLSGVGPEESVTFYIPDSEPDVMYRYVTSEANDNVVKRDEYTAFYTRRDGRFEPVEGGMMTFGLIGFERYRYADPDIGGVMGDTYEESSDNDWGKSFYKPGVSQFDGIVVEDNGDDSYILSYQEYNKETGADRWRSYSIKKVEKGWEIEPADGQGGSISQAEVEASDGGQSDN